MKMNVVAKFEITPSKCLKIVIPEFGEKENLFYEPIPELHRYDLVKVIFEDKDKETLLADDMITLIIENFKGHLVALLDDILILDSELEIGEFGRFYNNSIYYASDESDEYDERLYKYGMWSTGQGLHTSLYSREDKFYLEIAPVYPWLHTDEKKEKKFIPFEEFMRTYQRIAFVEIPRAQAEDWLKKCEDIEKILHETLDIPRMKPDVELYHTNPEENFIKYRQPEDGKAALKDSLPVFNKHAQPERDRIARSCDEWVVLVQRQDKVYTGHARYWHQLSPRMQMSLIHHGVTSRRGRTQTGIARVLKRIMRTWIS